MTLSVRTPWTTCQGRIAANLLLCQIESTTALRNLDRIASEPGVDCLWVGHMDLTQSMGIVGQFHHPDFLAALRDVAAACKEHGHLAGIQPGNLEQARDWMALGFDMISYSTDITIYSSALVSEVAAARGLVPKLN